MIWPRRSLASRLRPIPKNIFHGEGGVQSQLRIRRAKGQEFRKHFVRRHHRSGAEGTTEVQSSPVRTVPGIYERYPIEGVGEYRPQWFLFGEP